jgi:hypothetical protein
LPGDFERYVKRALETEHLSVCRGSIGGTWTGVSFLATLRNIPGKALEGKHLSLIKALETKHFFLQGLHKGNLKLFSKGGLGQYVYWAGTCT